MTMIMFKMYKLFLLLFLFSFSVIVEAKKSNYSVHHWGLSLSKTRNNISISALQIRLKVVTFAQASK